GHVPRRQGRALAPRRPLHVFDQRVAQAARSRRPGCLHTEAGPARGGPPRPRGGASAQGAVPSRVGARQGQEGNRDPVKTVRALGGARSRERGGRERADAMIESAIGELAVVVDTASACQAVGRPRATHYRRRRPPQSRLRHQPLRGQPRALSAEERAHVLEVLHSERFVDMAPPSVFATLLDEGRYLASVPTIYRILRSENEAHERRRQAVHPAYLKPELFADRPNRVWSWDITKLLGPVTYYYLYVILDIYSRYVPGWMVASRESAALAERLLAETIVKQGIDRDQLTIHADRGTSMASKPVALLLADLGVIKTHSRPPPSAAGSFVDQPTHRGGNAGSVISSSGVSQRG